MTVPLLTLMVLFVAFAVEVGWLMADASAPKLGRVEPVCLAAAVPDRIHHVACAT